jgi:hypothetical protein
MLTTTLWLLMNLFIVADWGQTRYIAMHEDAFHETNPILGGHPHRDKVDAFFLGSIVVNNGIMIALPDKYRLYYAGTKIAIQAGYVIHNNSIGVKVDF